MNGTLRDDENQICQNCGGVGHRKYDCPEQNNFTANIICRVCGSAGHMARDCQVKPDANAPAGAQGMAGLNKGNFDSEYASLMAELGESGAGSGPGKGVSSGLSITAGGSDIPPWRRPEMWQSTTNQNSQGTYRPQQSYGANTGYGGMYGGQQQSWYQGANYPQGYSGGTQDYSAAYAQYYQQQYNQTQTPTQ